MAKALIGTSGWQYPVFTDRFYSKALEKTAQLSYYSSEFPTVEVNNTFYHLPREATVRNWHDRVPEGFVFSVKASRYITHIKKLLEPATTLSLFFERISPFMEKCGPILFQLPPKFTKDADRLKRFLDCLPEDRRYAFEFRSRSWFTDEVYVLLREKNAAFCIHEINFQQSPLVVTADYVYIRLHGPGQAYADPYDLDALRMWAERIRAWTSSGRDVYCYFDNTNCGYAWENAKTLQSLLLDTGD
jgi:uncharacterized protein YecE (DUF72 family)